MHHSGFYYLKGTSYNKLRKNQFIFEKLINYSEIYSLEKRYIAVP